MRIFVIGNENCVLGFSLVGIEGQIVRDAAELEEALHVRLADKTIGLLLITSDVASLLRERIDALKVKSLSPLVVEIPGEKASSAPLSLKELVQRSIGIRLEEV